jgi:hypothetical protein
MTGIVAFTIWLANPVPGLPSYAECSRMEKLTGEDLVLLTKAYEVGGGWALQQKVIESKVIHRFWCKACIVRNDPKRLVTVTGGKEILIQRIGYALEIMEAMR